MYLLSDALIFPPPELASDEGVVAIGGDFAPERLVLAYAQGIFPWPTEGFPLLWFSPDPRFVLPPSEAHVPRSLAKLARKQPYRITADTAFEQVICECADALRPGQSGTWITDDLIEGYSALHRRGLAHSVEAWDGEHLVGGVYGVSLGRMFFGESMFARAPDASKLAFATLVGQLAEWDFALIDCQVHTPHLERFGAVQWPRERFLSTLVSALEGPTRQGPWELSVSPLEAIEALRAAHSSR